MVADEKSISEKRKYFRSGAPQKDIPLVTIEHNDIVLTECKIINLSAGGVAVVVRQPNELDIGSRINEITIKLPGGRGGICSPAVVKHVTKDMGGKWNIYGIEVVGQLGL